MLRPCWKNCGHSMCRSHTLEILLGGCRPGLCSMMPGPCVARRSSSGQLRKPVFHAPAGGDGREGMFVREPPYHPSNAGRGVQFAASLLNGWEVSPPYLPGARRMRNRACISGVGKAPQALMSWPWIRGRLEQVPYDTSVVGGKWAGAAVVSIACGCSCSDISGHADGLVPFVPKVRGFSDPS